MSTVNAHFQPTLIFPRYFSFLRAASRRFARETQETIMASDSSSPAATSGTPPDAGDAHLPKRSRPLSALQEAMFFGVTFTVALGLQLLVILKVSNIIAW